MVRKPFYTGYPTEDLLQKFLEVGTWYLEVGIWSRELGWLIVVLATSKRYPKSANYQIPITKYSFQLTLSTLIPVSTALTVLPPVRTTTVQLRPLALAL